MPTLFTVQVDIPRMVVLASSSEEAQQIAKEHLQQHLKKCEIQMGLWWIVEINKDTALTLSQMRSCPYGAATNLTVAGLLLNEL